MHAEELGTFKMPGLQQCISGSHPSQIHTSYPKAVRSSRPSWTRTLPLLSKESHPSRPRLTKMWNLTDFLEMSSANILHLPHLSHFIHTWKQHPFWLDALKMLSTLGSSRVLPLELTPVLPNLPLQFSSRNFYQTFNCTSPVLSPLQKQYPQQRFYYSPTDRKMKPLRGSVTCPTSRLVNETWLFTWMVPPQAMCFWLLHSPCDLPQVRFADCACLFINVTIIAHSSVSQKDLARQGSACS